MLYFRCETQRIGRWRMPLAANLTEFIAAARSGKDNELDLRSCYQTSLHGSQATD